ncbi:MAG: DUF3703 domain-containing protein [Ilumatobacter sp.]|uniref:DUF3703 domain-containing protein n=1 Tax=Ilumatobacter sp. TaxID=1967498 RepID=UPI0032974F61
MPDRTRRIPPHVSQWLAAELAAASTAADPWPHLERAHIVSQPWAWPHTRTHFHMLKLAAKRRDRRELAGQTIRLIVAGPGSLAGRYPIGNTGRTTMRLTEVADVPDDLAQILHAEQK